MASVRNQSDPQPQDVPNTVLFEMMMHYKRRMEVAEDACEHMRKRMRMEEEIHIEEMDAKDQLLHDARQVNRMVMSANLRGAHAVVRKHHAAMRMIECLDEVFSAVELVNETEMGGAFHEGVDYLTTCVGAIKERATVAFDLLLQEPGDELTSDEVIDVSGDSTEEDDEIEI